MSARPYRRARLVLLVVALFAALAPGLAARPAARAAARPVGARSAVGARQRQAAFARAAKEFGVPPRLLLAVSYNESRWDDHAGHPSISGAYGPMALTDVMRAALDGGKGAGEAGQQRLARDSALHTLVTAARLVGVSPATVESDPRQNIRGGAALLARYEKQLTGTLPSAPGKWYAAVARYSGSSYAPAALGFANDVYATMRRGATRTTIDGQALRLPATPVAPDRGQATSLRLRHTTNSDNTECPPTLHCSFVPAAYHLNNPNNVRDYGDYDMADRPTDGLKIQYIIIHDTEETFADTLRTFENPRSYVSIHYVIRSSDGAVVQMVPTKDVAWQAGNWYVNMHSVGTEHEGFAVQGATWFTEPMYHDSARLVRYLARRFDVPLDRAHILGHDNVPGITPAYVAGMHWDPGPYWDWAHYMRLLHAPLHRSAGPRSRVVTIDPHFATNKPPVSYCTSDGCRNLPRQPSNFVYLRTAPSTHAPLLSDPALHPDGSPGTTLAYDWGDKAVTGQQFAVARRHRGWTAIWYSGVRAWFRGPARARTALPTRGKLITPKPGRASIPTYGRAYPEPSAYPSDIPVQRVVPLQYTIKRGQAYVAYNKVEADYYYAKSYDGSIPDDRTVVTGHDAYYLIQLGHRMGYVRAADVRVVPAR